LDVHLPNNYRPRPYQRRVWRYLEGGGTRVFNLWHRRAGKDLDAAHFECSSAHEKQGIYWHVFPTFTQGRRALWDGFTKDGQRIMEQVFPGFLDPKRMGSIVRRKDDQQLFLELKCGSIWRLMGTDRSEFVGAGPQGIVFSEFALCRPRTWDLVRPMLKESGGWARFITTPRGRNHAWEVFEKATSDNGWYRDVQTVWDTDGQIQWHSNKGGHVITTAEMLDEERAEGMDEDTLQQEYGCDFNVANQGSIWAALVKDLEARGGLADYDSAGGDVFTTWDLGHSDSTAIWFWRLEAGSVHVFDFLEDSGKPLSFYLDALEDKGYRYRTHWLPHDARAKTLTTGSSTLEAVVDRVGKSAVRIVPMLSLADGIQAGRWLLQQKGTRIHPRCADGIEALRAYHYAYDEDAKSYSRKPEHDWSSHSADAFRYLAVVRRMAEKLLPKAVQVPKDDIRSLDKFTLDELWETNEAAAGGRSRV